MAAFAEGTPCWLDVALPDLEAGKRFYGELFGWTFGDDGDGIAEGGAGIAGGGAGYGQYTEAFSDGKRVGGLTAKRDGRMPTVWSIYFAVSAAAATSRRIRDAGGLLVREPISLGRFGVVALAADPAGAVFGLLEAGEDTGFEKTGLPGSFCWTEVYTRDAAAVDPFYESVFGFRGTDVTDDDTDDTADSGTGGGTGGADGDSDDHDRASGPAAYRMWSPPGAIPGRHTAVAGRSVITEAFPVELPGHFLSYFSVADCDATAAAVTRLGGRVTGPPYDIEAGRMAVFADNQGAAFAVLAEPRDTAEG